MATGRRHFGSLRKLPSGRWQASYWHRGLHNVAPATFATKAGALAFLAVIETDVRRGVWIDPQSGRMTVAELGAQWLASNPGKRKDTLATDEYHLRVNIVPKLGPHRITDVTPSDLQSLVNEWSARLAPRTVSRAYGVARALFAHGVACDLIGRSPCRGVKLPRVDATSRRAPTPAEIGRLAGAMPRRYRPMVYLGAIIGLRFSEVAGLRLGRLDFSERSISVLETITRDAQGSPVFGPPKSTASRRTVALPAPLVDLLAEHVREQHLDLGDTDALVFTAPGGGPIRYANWRNRVWVPACEAAGLQGIGFHSLRRASATALVYARVDLKTAQTRLGHSDPRLTLSIYAHAADHRNSPGDERRGGLDLSLRNCQVGTS